MKNISIIRKNFGTNEAKITLFFTSIFFIAGVFLSIFNFKEALCSISITALFYFFLSKRSFKIIYILIPFIIFFVVNQYILSLDFILTLIISVLLSCIFLILKLFRKINRGDDFEVFYIDHKTLKCLAPEYNDYKGYALNPTSYLKIYSISDIEAIEVRKNSLLIVICNKIIRPRELTYNEIIQIKTYIENNLSNLLINKDSIRNSLKSENRDYIRKLITIIPIILIPIIIYLFAENGNNVKLTYTLILLMICLSILLFKLTKRFFK